MNKTGIIEGFFGPQWPHEARLSFAKFIKDTGGGFYIYAPKQDANLRKSWRSQWSAEYQNYLKELINTFHKEGVDFGVGFSPFGLGSTLTALDKSELATKLTILNDLGIDILGLFFDDMPVNDQLAETQIETLSLIQESFKGRIIFCPSYYTPDPILDKVFGTRPPDYLKKIAKGISQDVSIAWTGPKVISPEIPREHLVETRMLLNRRPFLWENLFANDGPKNCKFLKLTPFTGRSHEAFAEVEAFGFNMMNQAELSKIVYLSAKYVLEGKFEADRAFQESLSHLCSEGFAKFISKNQECFLKTGLDKMDPTLKEGFLSELRQFSDPAAREIEDWLQDKYIVGSECLTD